jgi:peptide/nickel transport system substrate-binding protein
MSSSMKRRNFLHGASLAAGTLPFLGRPTLAQKNAAKTLKIIHNGNLSSLDPIWTTAPPTKDYGFLVFDQLLAVDSKYVPHPQMAEGWTVEDDGKTYVLGLREGLKFHDNEPVRSTDCIASIQRWGARDGFGQLMMRFVDTFEVVDDRKFKIKLKKPFALLPAALGKSNSSQCFIMPERMAKVDPMKQVTETIGSGPYRFLKNEFVSGAKAAWARFDGYIPRKEPVDSIAGGRIPAVDRIEWSFISDPSTAMAALVAGEQDYWDAPTLDLVQVMKADPNIVVSPRNPTGSYYMLQLNHTQAPFNNPKVRQALAMAIDQDNFLKAAVSDPALMKPVYSYYGSDSPYYSEQGADVLKVKNLDKAKAALKESGYAGEKVVILGVMESPILAAMAQVTEDLMRRMGMNVELVAMDFATMAQRRTSKEPADKGGWGCFVTVWTGSDIVNPAVHQMLRAGGPTAWFGWPTDPKMEQLRDQWAEAITEDEQKKHAVALQVEAFKTLPYIPLGSLVALVAYRKNLTGVWPCPVQAYWNIGKS